MIKDVLVMVATLYISVFVKTTNRLKQKVKNLIERKIMKAKQIRWSRIIKHSIQYFFTLNKIYKYEIEHYYYMVKFKL
jgi:hypothetical protein